VAARRSAGLENAVRPRYIRDVLLALDTGEC